MQRIEPGTVFTRKDIAALFGGNARAFLPRLKTGEIVAGCFDPVKNPRAPHEALVHSSGNAEVNARRFLQQSSADPAGMPVFIRLAANVWAYRGNFRAVRYTKSKREVEMRIYEIHPRIYERHVRDYGEIRGILFLEEV
jgi:hypothetical protein